MKMFSLNIYMTITHSSEPALLKIIVGFTDNLLPYTTFTNFSIRYLVMCKVFTDVEDIK